MYKVKNYQKLKKIIYNEKFVTKFSTRFFAA